MIVTGGVLRPLDLGPRSYGFDVRHDVTVTRATILGRSESYGLHIDHSGVGRAEFVDCVIHGVGIGMTPGQEIIFRGCTFVGRGGDPGIYLHSASSDVAPILIACRFDLDGGPEVAHLTDDDGRYHSRPAAELAPGP